MKLYLVVPLNLAKLYVDMVLIRALLLLSILSVDIKGYCQTNDTLINAGKYKLHFHVIKGVGTPIIFESGAGNDGTIWKDLLPLLKKRTEAPLITYDRAGFGKSEIDSTNLNITSEVRTLNEVLKKLGYSDSYFLVAHSLGGNYAMKFISDNKKKVLGAVFIDIVSPYFMTKERAKYTKNLFADSLEAIKKESIGFYHLVLNYENTSEVMRRVSKNISIPLTIIGSDRTPFEGTDRTDFRQSLKKFAEDKGNRKYVFAKNSGHYIFLDSPDIVINEIVSQYKAVFKE
ncbi:alpha/beta fold hydrolase [Olivibacter domesticus]|uniref:Pimeloyl-ACP methyl ester carboxylesterase n=1 Tax=Olivibacter domesticus TaxID=407022 RepID=A0A1H7JT62_OLID1|nr:alpha/beta hydrolase [Olivibacter domesticus]SEK77702.1 Pimeloyl-ACP methyl ester carboxylesterase [Olivibacter domesticus]